jgi:hypothetical protein
MGKILCLLSAIFLFSINSNGQINISDNIDLGPTAGNLQSIATPGEWGTTHGTPSYSPTQIWMWAANQSGSIGEGVYRKMNILQGGNYNIGIGIDHFTNNTSTGGFVVLLANDPLPTNCNAAGCPVPSFNSSRPLYYYAGPSFTSNELNLKFSTAIEESYKYLIIYPLQLANSAGTIELQITCLTALSCTSSDRTFCGTIQAGDNFHKNIFIGSEFCQVPGQATSIASENTTLAATTKIVLKPNTHISVNSGKSFVMKISPCLVELPSVPGDDVISGLTPKQQLCYYSRPGHTSTNETISNVQTPEVYPNPTRDNIQIKLNSNGEKSTIVIMKMDGQVMKTMNSSSSTELISLSEFAPGPYLIKIISGKSIVIKKVIRIN